MRKDMRNSFIVLGVIAVMVAALGYYQYGKNEITKEIFKYVEDNEKELENVAKEYIKGEKVSLPEHVKKIEVYSNKYNTMAEFTYKIDNNKEYGFYYSVENHVSAYHNKSVDLLELGGDKWMWSLDNMEGNVNKIKDLWYYYKVVKK